MGRKNKRDKSNNYYTERQQERELDKLRKELIKPKFKKYPNKSSGKFVKKQK